MSNTTDAVMAKLAAIKMENDDEDQYKKKCDNKCGCVLGIDVPIMCWMKGDEEMTLCSECYYDAGFWEDDENPDNEDESEDESEDDEEQD